MPEKWVLQQLQGLPLDVKVLKTKQRIREWYEHFNGDVYVSFSGGKDSTVLAHIVHELYPDVPLVFVNTGLEYPEIQAFARKMGATFVRPAMMFADVISKCGYPIIGKEVAEAIYWARNIPKAGEKSITTYKFREELLGKRIRENGEKSKFNKDKWMPLANIAQFKISKECCKIIKKNPAHKYQMETKQYPYIATLTEESLLRTQSWLKHGCNSFDERKKTSQPLSFWTEQDILKYLKQEGLEIASIYGEIVATDKNGFEYEPMPGVNCKLKCTGCQRTGCIFCIFGAHHDKEKGPETRFQRLARTHPKQYEYCMNGGQWVDNPDYDPTAPEKDGEWVNWNPKKIWVPSKKGLGIRKVLDDCNQIYGKDFIRYD